MLPSVGPAGVLGGGLRPLGHSSLPAHNLLGSLAPFPLPFSMASTVAGTLGSMTAPFVMESVMRDRTVARPVATKPPPLLLPDDPRHEQYYHKDDVAAHYLGLLARPAGPDRLTPPVSLSSPPRSREGDDIGGGGLGGCGCDGEGGHSPGPDTPSSKPHLKFSVTAILGHDTHSHTRHDHLHNDHLDIGTVLPSLSYTSTIPHYFFTPVSVPIFLSISISFYATRCPYFSPRCTYSPYLCTSSTQGLSRFSFLAQIVPIFISIAVTSLPDKFSPSFLSRHSHCSLFHADIALFSFPLARTLLKSFPDASTARVFFSV